MAEYIKTSSIIGMAYKMAFGRLLTEREVNVVETVIRFVHDDVRVDLVRCGECKYADKYCHCGRVVWWTDDDDFCSKGERKGGADGEND